MRLEDLVERLEEFDLLLSTDSKFPSVSGLVVGDVGGRSWWAHPQAKQMYGLSCALHDHPDVLMVKLISGKVTFIHRPLWPAIVAVGTAREPWQVDGLSKGAQTLLKRVERGGKEETSGDAVRELEDRLLAHAVSFHTERGLHKKEVQSWTAWAKSVGLGKVKLKPVEAKAQLEAVVERLNQQFGAKGTLPWQTKRRKEASARVPTRHA
jgi:hypothetical protein